jgi:hypothetical protein
MKTSSTGSGFEDADDENTDASPLENQGQFVLKFGYVNGGLHHDIASKQAALIRRSFSRPCWR